MARKFQNFIGLYVHVYFSVFEFENVLVTFSQKFILNSKINFLKRDVVLYLQEQSQNQG